MGKIEIATLKAVLKLRNNAYGVSIQEEIEQRLRRSVPDGQIYITLARLEHKGYLKSQFGEPTPERGGRAKKFYTVTGAGQKALNVETAEIATVFGFVGLKDAKGM